LPENLVLFLALGTARQFAGLFCAWFTDQARLFQMTHTN